MDELLVTLVLGLPTDRRPKPVSLTFRGMVLGASQNLIW